MRILATMLVALVLPVPVNAQQTDTASTTNDTLPRPTSIAPVYATASRLPVQASRLGFSMTAIQEGQIDAHQPMYLADALRSLAGGHVEEAAGPGGPTILRVRGGEEVFTQILLDGVQLNQNGGFFDFQGLMLSNVGRVDVLRGPQSALYGSTAMSGVVQMFTPRGEPGQVRATATAEGGHGEERGGTYRGNVDVSGGTETFRYSAGAARGFSRGNFQLPHNLRSNDASLRFDFVPSDRWTITTIGRFMGIESKLPVRDPGATRVPLDPTAGNQRDRLITSVGLEFKPSASHTHSVRASRYGEDFVYNDRKDGVDNSGNEFFLFDANFILNSEFSRTAAEYVGRFHPAQSRVAISYGMLAEREALEEASSGDYGPASLAVDRNSGAAFGEVRLAASDRFEILTGARIEKYEDLDPELTPRASAIFEIVPGRVTLRAAAGAGFKAPNLQQEYAASAFIASNPDLEPETSTSYEAGVDLRQPNGALTVTLFTQRFTNLIRTVALEGTQQQINRNLGGSHAKGVEMTLDVQPSPRIGGSVDVVVLRTRIDDNTGLSPREFPVGESLPFRPAFAGSAELRVAPAQRIGLALRASALGSQWVLTERFSGQRVRIPAHVIGGVTAAYSFDSRVTAMLRVENITNTRFDAAYDRPGAGRYGALGLRVQR